MYRPNPSALKRYCVPIQVLPGRNMGSRSYLFIVVVYLLTTGRVLAQDVEQTVQDVRNRFENPLTYNGQLGIQISAYQSDLEIDRSPPVAGMINAGLNIGILGVQTPLNFIYSSGGTAFNVTLPSFGFAGISPSYRGYTLHLGDRSMELGKYSFSNHSFRGVGAEINKNKWYTRGFYGRLQRAQISDFRGFQNVNPLLRRMGWGVLAGYAPSSKSAIEFSLFKGWDNAQSIPLQLIDSSFNIYASENVILSTTINQSLANRVHLKMNYSTSGFTERQDLSNEVRVNSFKRFLGILETNKSSRWNKAIEAGLEMRTGIGQLSLTYEKIDPGYRTLGALFFQDDQENITVGLATQVFENKLSLIANGGLQRNNLANDKADHYRRFIGSVYANFQASEKLSFNLGFSNFSAVNRQIRILDPNNPNTLTELALTNLNLNGGIQWRLTEIHQLAANFSYQNNQTITTSDAILEQMNNVNNVTLLYNNVWKSAGLNSSFQIFYSRFAMPQLEQYQKGIALNVSRNFRNKKLRSTLGLAFNRNEQGNLLTRQQSSGNLLQAKIGCAWQMSLNQQLQADSIVLSNAGKNINSFFESRFNLRYAINLQSRSE